MEKIKIFFVIIVGILLIPFYAIRYIFQGISLNYFFRKKLNKQNKYILFVYSDSTSWKEYIEENILPNIDEHTIVLNWSKRLEWEKHKPIEAKVLEYWGGEREFNPIAIVFSPKKRVQTIRFFKAFKQLKKGKIDLLEEQELKLYNC